MRRHRREEAVEEYGVEEACVRIMLRELSRDSLQGSRAPVWARNQVIVGLDRRSIAQLYRASATWTYP